MLRVVFVAFAAFYMTELLRTLPIIRGWYVTDQKPIACSVCMAFWMTWAFYFLPLLILSPLAAMGGSLLLLRIGEVRPT